MRSRKLPGLPILTLDTGTNIGQVREPLIDDEAKKVVALFVKKGRGLSRYILPMRSIHAFGSHAVTVESEQALRPMKSPGDLQTLLQKKRIPLLGTPVVTRLGGFVGTVKDFEMNGTGEILSVVVTDGLWRSISGQERSFPGRLMMALGMDAVIVTEEALTWTTSEETEGETPPSAD